MKPADDTIIGFPKHSTNDHIALNKSKHNETSIGTPTSMHKYYSLILCDPGKFKINVLKVVRHLNPKIGLIDGKCLLDNPPFIVAERMSERIVNRIKTIFEEAGAVMKIQACETIHYQSDESCMALAEASAHSTSDFDVILDDAGQNKIAVIKLLRELLPGLGLADTKQLVDSAPVTIAENIPWHKAVRFRNILTKEYGAASILPHSRKSLGSSKFHFNELIDYLAKYSFCYMERIESKAQLIIEYLQHLIGSNHNNTSDLRGNSPSLNTKEM